MVPAPPSISGRATDAGSAVVASWTPSTSTSWYCSPCLTRATGTRSWTVHGKPGRRPGLGMDDGLDLDQWFQEPGDLVLADLGQRLPLQRSKGGLHLVRRQQRGAGHGDGRGAPAPASRWPRPAGHATSTAHCWTPPQQHSARRRFPLGSGKASDVAGRAGLQLAGALRHRPPCPAPVAAGRLPAGAGRRIRPRRPSECTASCVRRSCCGIRTSAARPARDCRGLAWAARPGCRWAGGC